MGLFSGDREFFVLNYEPILLSNGNEPLHVYPSAREYLQLERGIWASTIQRLQCEREVSFLNWKNTFQRSKPRKELEERNVATPGFLIRFADEVAFDEKFPNGVCFYFENVSLLARCGEWIWDATPGGEKSSIPSPKLYLAFASRTYFPLKRNALKTEGVGSLERMAKEGFKSFLSTPGVVCEALTPEGLRNLRPDSVLIQEAMDKGVEVGVSHYKLTDLAIATYINDWIDERAEGEVREQFGELQLRLERGSATLQRVARTSEKLSKSVLALPSRIGSDLMIEFLDYQLKKNDDGAKVTASPNQ